MVAIKTIGSWLKLRILGNYRTTVVGCVAASMGAVGQYLESLPSTKYYGMLLVNVSGIMGTIALMLSADKPKEPND